VPASPPSRLTDRAFWEREYYWGGGGDHPVHRVDLTQSFDRSLARALESWAPVQRGDRVLEIGCAPAKWLVFYADRFGAEVEGIEYSEQGASLSTENLERCGVSGAIHHADFFTFEPRPYELVLSLGFIEHFTDVAQVFSRHTEFVARGGRLVLGVPNFRGIHRLVQSLADREYLERHNAVAMSPGLYRDLAERHGLIVEQIRYIAGIDPSIIKIPREHARTHPRRLVPGVVTLAERRFRRTALGERLQHPWASSYLLAGFRRPP
jgi:SAM-dependent methyltransferase